MNDTQSPVTKAPWRKPLKRWTLFAALSGVLFVVLCTASLVLAGNQRGWELVPISLVGAVVLAAGLCLGFVALRWLSRWQNLRRVLFGVACLITLIALAYAEENWRGQHAWLRYRRAHEAKGESFDLITVAPPPVPDEKNFALTPLLRPMLDYTNGPGGVTWRDANGYARLQQLSVSLPREPHSEADLPLGRLERGTFADLKGCAEFYRGNTNYPQAAASATPAETVLVALSKFAPELQELREAAVDRPSCRYPIHYTDEPPFAILLPHLAPLKRLVLLTEVQAVAELEASRPAEALQDVQVGLRLSDSLHGEPLLISHLVRLASLQLVLQTVREGLHRHRWTEPQLADLEASLSSLDLLAEYKAALRGERAFSAAGFDYMRRQGWGFNANEYLSNAPGGGVPPVNAMPGGWLCQNLLTILQWADQFALPAVDERAHRVYPEINEQGRVAVQHLRAGPYTLFATMLLPALTNLVQKPARAQVYVDSARVACALERYRLAEGKLPQNLTDLVPRFLSSVPKDVMDGQPLRYRLQPDGGYRLYSVGWNQLDEGGVLGSSKHEEATDSPRAADVSRGDWVWKMGAVEPVASDSRRP